LVEAARVRVRVKEWKEGVTAGSFSQQVGGASSIPYEAASRGRRLRTWTPGDYGPNAALDFSVETLRARSRDQLRQNAHASRASDAWVSNVVGTGIKPLSKSPDKDFQQAIQHLWDDWQEFADSEGILDFYGLQGQIARGVFDGGEVFVRRRLRRQEDNLPLPMQLQVMEAEYCPMHLNFTSGSGNPVRNGIEYNKLGQPIFYWFYRSHPGDWHMLPSDLSQYTRVPAKEVLHIFLPSRPGQKRGEPFLTRALVTLRDLDQWNDATLVRQKMSQMFMGVIQKTQDPGPSLGEQDPDAVESYGESQDENTEFETQTLSPGTMTELEEGEEVKWSDPPDVGNNYETFLRERLRAVSASLGIMYEQLTNDYSQINDRTYRAAHNELKRNIERIQQTMMVPMVCRPVWRWFYGLAVGTRTLPRPSSLADRDAKRVIWVPQGFRHIHPLQDKQADRMDIRSGLKSRQKVVLERGESAEEVDQQVAEDNARMDEMGLVYDSDPRKVSQAGLAQSSDPMEPGTDSNTGEE